MGVFFEPLNRFQAVLDDDNLDVFRRQKVAEALSDQFIVVCEQDFHEGLVCCERDCHVGDGEWMGRWGIAFGRHVPKRSNSWF